MTWAATAFGLLVGVGMVYVPHEFGAPLFRYAYPHIRILGAGFLAGSTLLIAAGLYPEWPRLIDRLGRALLIGAMAVYWWFCAVLVGGFTGAVVYPLMFVAVVVEGTRWARTQRYSALVPFLSAASVALGAVMVAFPRQFSPSIYELLFAVARPLGAAFLAGGVAFFVAEKWGSPNARRLVTLGLASVFAFMGGTLVGEVTWSGAALYLTMAVTLGLLAFVRGVRIPSSIRWRLWRGMVLTSCVPLLLLGALGCVLMQRAIEQQAMQDAERAVAAEIEWLSKHLDAERHSLAGHADLASFRESVARRESEIVALSLQVLRFHASNFEAIFVVDERGQVFARTDPQIPGQPDQSSRDFARAPLQHDGVYFSEPFVGHDGSPRVVLARRVRHEGRTVGVLCGTISLAELSRAETLTSSSWNVQVVDRRNGRLIRETATRDALSASWLPDPLQRSLSSAGGGAWVGPDPGKRQVLAVWSPVPGTPWIAVASQDVARAYEFVTRLGLGAVAVVSIGALLALLLSQWVALEVTRRLRRVREAAEGIAEGKLSMRVDVVGRDELASLSASFNQMAEQIQSAQGELRRINDDLRAAVALRDEFVSIASHELRTPLTPLKATAQTLRHIARRQGPIDTERLITMTERMDRQIDRLLVLVNDMLDISRIQGGRFALTPERVDLRALVLEVADRTRAVSAESQDRLRVQVPDGPVIGTWDGARLEQVVVNLLENALRYSPKGGEVRITLTEHENGDLIRLTVADHGIGIPADGLSQVFEPFFRASNATARHFGGLGLGLHICREIAQRHGGRIWAESDGPDRGSRFHLELPRHAPGGEASPGWDESAA